MLKLGHNIKREASKVVLDQMNKEIQAQSQFDHENDNHADTLCSLITYASQLVIMSIKLFYNDYRSKQCLCNLFKPPMHRVRVTTSKLCKTKLQQILLIVISWHSIIIHVIISCSKPYHCILYVLHYRCYQSRHGSASGSSCIKSFETDLITVVMIAVINPLNIILPTRCYNTNEH